MTVLEGKKILLVSPQPWDHIHISKHHYALELARRGNEVVFLDPPGSSVQGKVSLDGVAESSHIKVLRYGLEVPMAVRIHARPVFDVLINRRIAAFKRLVGIPDVVWCFEFNLFRDLRVFGGRTKLFHPVDPVSQPHHLDVARSADLVISVSEEILSWYRDIPVPRLLVNHGLPQAFVDAYSEGENVQRRPGPPRVGYSGNLGHHLLNRVVLLRMVNENPGVEFHFWGPSETLDGEAPELKNDVRAFVQELQRRENAIVHGRVSTSTLASDFQQMDCFVSTYLLERGEHTRRNSHKLLEYLSAGKVVISSRIATYEGREDLIEMPSDSDDSVLPQMLRDTLQRLPELNSAARQAARRNFALQNTYERQVDCIQRKLSAMKSS